MLPQLGLAEHWTSLWWNMSLNEQDIILNWNIPKQAGWGITRGFQNRGADSSLLCKVTYSWTASSRLHRVTERLNTRQVRYTLLSKKQDGIFYRAFRIRCIFTSKLNLSLHQAMGIQHAVSQSSGEHQKRSPREGVDLYPQTLLRTG